MIDTVRFKIPYIPSGIYKSLVNKGNSYTHKEQGKTKFEVFKHNINLGSYYRNVGLFAYEQNSLYIEFSAPKYVYGHNVLLLYPSQLESAILKLYNELNCYYSVLLPNPLTWILQRLDICYAWKINKPEEALMILKAFNFPRKYKTERATSIDFRSDNSTFKFYLKNPEFIKHDLRELTKLNQEELAQTGLLLSKNVLRVEITLRKKALQREFKKKKMVYTDILDLDNYYKILNKYIYKLTKLDNNSSMTLLQAKNRLLETYGTTKGAHLFLFLDAYKSDNDVKKSVLNDLSRRTYFRNIKLIKDAGISLSDPELTDSFDFSVPSRFVINSEPPIAHGSELGVEQAPLFN